MDKIVVLDFGGQYAHLIANRIRKLGVFSEIKEGNVSALELKNYKGIIMSGGPASVSAADSVKCDPTVFEMGLPILGICYGHQLVGHFLGGEVKKGQVSEYGQAKVKFLKREGVFEGVSEEESVWMSHFDQVVKAPEGFEIVASTCDCPIAAMMNKEKRIYTLQFHPEVTHTPCGMGILENFVRLTGALREWNIENYIEQILAEIKEKVGMRKVFLMISGGVDSTVAFSLLAKALSKDHVYGLFVDTGFMRMGERKEVETALKAIGVDNLHVYDGADKYFAALEGVYEPEEKRKIIGDLFIDIQQEVSQQLGLNPDEWMLGQGTIYPDWIETGGSRHADKIKTHHNRVERIQKLEVEGKVIEPLVQLYKDEVRLVGEKLGLPHKLVWRHPFPGPGLAVRCLCAKEEDWSENFDKLNSSLNEVAKEEGFTATVLPIKSVGVQGDERTYRHPVLLCGESRDWHRLNTLATRLTNQCHDINRVLLCLNACKVTDLRIQKNYMTRERILTIQQADKVAMDYIAEAQIDKEIWQFPTVLLPLILNNGNGESIVLRPVESQEAMTANFYPMKERHLTELVKRLSSLQGISGIFYDITNKPPGTIEWE